MRKKSIVFVCTGNTCRSPMAEIILKNKLKLAGITSIRVSSAGLNANAGDKISPNSAKALKQLGYRVGAFKAKPLTPEIIGKSDLIICMTESHKRCLYGLNGVCTISELTGQLDVLDPFGGSLALYIETSHQLEDACNIILNKILEEKGNTRLVFIVVLVLVFGYALSGILMKPFGKITRAIEGITDGFQSEDISVPDYTETELITDAFNQMLGRVRAVDTSRQEFVSNVSHELKTPLTSMKVLADSLVGQDNIPVELYQEFMQDIASEIDRENKIITDLLTLVRMDKKAAALQIGYININEMLEMIMKRLKPIASKKNVDLTLECIRDVNAEIDETKLSLAFNNLVENAIKYNVEDGWVKVSLDADHKYFYVVVSDSGMGIPEDSIDHIFERFYRVDKSHSTAIEGTGLGLAITKGAIMMHHGAIRVNSKEKEGTIFSVRIPLKYIK